MSYCGHCRTELGNVNVNFCPSCGMPTAPTAINRIATVNDSGSFGWAILGFLIPVLGFILYLVWKRARPNSARRAANGALFGYTFGFLFGLVSLLMSSSMLMLLI